MIVEQIRSEATDRLQHAALRLHMSHSVIIQLLKLSQTRPTTDDLRLNGLACGC